jgi:ubiquinone/menaquinone biosynthesis C-methylase UbiE
MSDLFKIYQSQAKNYQNLISHEDVDNNLLPSIQNIVPLKGRRLLDLGTGTGRIPSLIEGHASQIIGIDLHWDMLRENSFQRKTKHKIWDLLQGDYRLLPFPNRYFDIITAGWSISALIGQEDKDWKAEISLVIKEIQRTINPSGVIIIIETMSTASETPLPPTEALANYYTWLENEWDFNSQVIQTDYLFDDLEQAVSAIEFFFGVEMSAKVREKEWARVPEWTGIWSKILPG